MRTATVLLLVLALAGCFGASDGKAEDEAPSGVLHGVVVDEAIRPLAGARVSLGLADGQEVAVITGDDGAWGFGGLSAGVYLVRTTLFGYSVDQTQANVTLGDLEPPRVRIVLVFNQTIVTRIESFVFDGYLQCSMTAVAVRQACNANEATRPVCDMGAPCPPDVTDDKFLAVHTVSSGGIAFLQSELNWDASSGLGESLRAVPGSRDATGALQDFEAAEGPSPLIVPMTGEVANALAIGNGKDYAVRVFSSYASGTEPPCLPSPAGCQWGVGMAFQQRFGMVTHVFYGFTPPEGWQFGRDGLPPLPA